jgi:ATP-dependent DNA helicase RecQ
VTELSHFGALRWSEDRLRELLRELVDSELLRQTHGEYPVLEITRAGRLALAGQGTVEVSLPAPAPQPAAPGPATQLRDADPQLLDRLKRWRLEVSRNEGVPAYVVFHDRTLGEIAAQAPRDLQQLGTIPGVGPAKLVRYGEQVLALIGRA